MNRRRLLWLGLTLIALGVIVAAWFWMSQRDADFIVIVGPKTKGVRENLALLEMTIDPADFRGCKTLEHVSRMLNLRVIPKLFPDEPRWNNRPANFPAIWMDEGAFVHDDPNTKWSDLAFQMPDDSASMPMKEFLQTTFAKTGAQDVRLIVNGYYVYVSTSERAQEARAEYLDRVSVFDRIGSLWKEITGEIEEDPFVGGLQ